MARPLWDGKGQKLLIISINKRNIIRVNWISARSAGCTEQWSGGQQQTESVFRLRLPGAHKYIYILNLILEHPRLLPSSFQFIVLFESTAILLHPSARTIPAWTFRPLSVKQISGLHCALLGNCWKKHTKDSGRAATFEGSLVAREALHANI